MARRTEVVEARTRLGTRRIDPDKIIEFPRGLMGFEDQREFTLLQLREDAPFLVLQSLQDPELGLLVGDPYAFLPEYRIKIGDAEQNMLQVKTAGELAVLVTVSIPPVIRNAPPSTSPAPSSSTTRRASASKCRRPTSTLRECCCTCARPGITERTRRPRPQTRRRAPMPLLPP